VILNLIVLRADELSRGLELLVPEFKSIESFDAVEGIEDDNNSLPRINHDLSQHCNHLSTQLVKKIA
jgi:hypothetical protein